MIQQWMMMNNEKFGKYNDEEIQLMIKKMMCIVWECM